MPAMIPVTTTTASAYEAENRRRAAAKLPLVRTAVARVPVEPVPARPAASKAPPAPRPTLRAKPQRLVWVKCGLDGPGDITGRGHAATCEAFERSAVLAIADRINRGIVKFCITVDHREVVDSTESGRVSVRAVGSDLLVRWRPPASAAALVELLELSGRLPASVDISAAVRATCSGGIRMIESGDVHGVSILTAPDARGAYWRANAMAAPAEGSIDCFSTCMKYMALLGPFAEATT